MADLKNFTKMSLNVLKDESKSRGLPETGTRTDLCTRLYAHDIKRLKQKYLDRKEEGFARDPDGSRLRAHLDHVKTSIKAAARHRFLAEEAYLDKRRTNALSVFEDKLQDADDFVKVEGAEIEKGVNIQRKRRDAKKAIKAASKVSFLDPLI